MPNEEHLRIIKQGVDVWNKWREENKEIIPDLYSAELKGANLRGVNFFKVDLSNSDLGEVELMGAVLFGANLRGCNFKKANLSGADLRGANLWDTNFYDAQLKGADLTAAELVGCNLKEANLKRAILKAAYINGAKLENANLMYADISDAQVINSDLSNAVVVGTDFSGSILEKCFVYGISGWDIKLHKAKQSELRITHNITVADLEVAQFIYLLLNRPQLGNVIDTITSKAVLILGRFTPERKVVLDAMGNELRKNNLLPIIFDFERAKSRDFTETIKTLAGLSLFIIADITNPKSASLELQATIPDYQIPFVPIIEKGEQPFAMFRDLPKYPWVLKLLTYPSLPVLLKGFKKAIIDEAFETHKKLLSSKARSIKTRSVEDYLGEGKVK